jgi:triosephosphate isomerase
VARKIRAAVAAGLTPVVCVGEKLAERRGGQLEEVLSRQLDTAVGAIGQTAFIIAYEPVWAIGTGVNATPQDASAAHRFLRDRLRAHFGSRADSAPILYGGSVKPDNAAALLAAPDVDGLLVGGASLDPAGFAVIAAA